jgi:hypothetical protein
VKRSGNSRGPVSHTSTSMLRIRQLVFWIWVCVRQLGLEICGGKLYSFRLLDFCGISLCALWVFNVVHEREAIRKLEIEMSDKEDLNW